MSEKEITLDSLVGEHLLDGVDLSSEKIKESYGDGFEDCNIVKFRLDGVIYTAIEDPDDGYRSSMRSITVGGEISNSFPAVHILVRKKPDGDYVNDVLEFVDVETGKIILEVGTDNTDDYYPCFVGYFSPENMSINAAKK